MNLVSSHNTQTKNRNRRLALRRAAATIAPRLARAGEIDFALPQAGSSRYSDPVVTSGARTEALILAVMGILSGALVPMLIVAATLINPYVA